MLRNHIVMLAAVCALTVPGAAAFDPAFAAASKCDDVKVLDAYPADRPPVKDTDSRDQQDKSTKDKNIKDKNAKDKNANEISANEKKAKDKKSGDSPANSIKLFETVEVKVSALPALTEAECRDKKLVVFLNGVAVKLAPNAYDAEQKLVRFKFDPSEGPASAWAVILGRPDFKLRPVRVSLGYDGEAAAFTSTIEKPLQLQIIDLFRFGFWLVVFVLLLIAFWLFARQSNIIRDGSPTEFEPGKPTLGTFSLSKWQGAWWFFVILSTYLLIGLVTGQFFSSLNSTAIILLGIGAGTVLTSAVIDAQKDTPANRSQIESTAAKLKDEIATLNTDLGTIKTGLVAATTAADKDRLTTEQASKSNEIAQKTSAHEKLARRSEGFVKDILSDANGVSFHRFQNFAWTIVLSIVFVKNVYEGLAMPTFDATLMGLLGLSAATYLGLKIPEPIVPK
jgi:hypothetical protein